MINNIAGYALSIVGAIYIGRLGSLPLSASVLANSLYNCTGLSLALGLSAGMETLCGQVSNRDRMRWHESALASARGRKAGQAPCPDWFAVACTAVHSHAHVPNFGLSQLWIGWMHFLCRQQPTALLGMSARHRKVRQTTSLSACHAA